MKTLLVVDEDLESLHYVRDLLKESGYAGSFAEDPEEAARIAGAEATVDLLLASVQALTADPDLPARLSALHPGLRIVFTSPHPVRLLEREGIRVPGSHFLRKPFSRVQLLDALDRACESSPWARAWAEAAESLEKAA
jgi:DNA-binding NtrC family response regulator